MGTTIVVGNVYVEGRPRQGGGKGRKGGMEDREGRMGEGYKMGGITNECGGDVENYRGRRGGEE